MLSDFILKNETFLLQESVETWQEAVKKGVDLLVKAGVAKDIYYDGIIDSVKQYGPYFVITKGVAMPHARPEDGAIGTGFSLVTLKEPINFNHNQNDPVKIIICICAKDSKEMNEEVILETMTLLDNDNLMKMLEVAHSKEELADILNSIDE